MSKVFSVYDSKAKAWMTPIFAPTKGVAMRSFAQAANTQDSDFQRWAADYTLFQIGTWDDQTGDIEKDEAKSNLGTALEHQEQAEE